MRGPSVGRAGLRPRSGWSADDRRAGRRRHVASAVGGRGNTRRARACAHGLQRLAAVFGTITTSKHPAIRRTTAGDVATAFDRRLDVLLDGGPSPGGPPSTSDGRWTADALRMGAVMGRVLNRSSEAPRHPDRARPTRNVRLVGLFSSASAFDPVTVRSTSSRTRATHARRHHALQGAKTGSITFLAGNVYRSCLRATDAIFAKSGCITAHTF